MMFAIILGSGALMAVVALAMDGGQMYFRNRQVHVAADSAVEAMANACRARTAICESLTVTKLDTARNYVNAVISANGATISDSGYGLCIKPEGSSGAAICSSGFTEAMASAQCGPLVYPRGPAQGSALVAGAPWIKIAIRAAADQAYKPVLLQRDPIRYAACGKATWSSGVSRQVPNPLLFPACGFRSTTPPSQMFVDGNSSNGFLDLRDFGSAECPAPQWTKGSNTAATYTDTPRLQWMIEIAAHKQSLGTCGTTETLTLLTAYSASGSPYGMCGSASLSSKMALRNYLYRWLSGPDRYVAVGGPVRQNLGSGSNTDYIVKIVAFAEFRLTAFYDGLTNSEDSTANGRQGIDSSGKWVQYQNGSYVAANSVPGAGICSIGNLCLLGSYINSAEHASLGDVNQAPNSVTVIP